MVDKDRSFVHVEDWCKENRVNYVSMLKLLRKFRAKVTRVGSEFFVDTEEVLRTVWYAYSMEASDKTERKRALAKERADFRKEQTAVINEILASKSLPSSDQVSRLRAISDKLKPKAGGGGNIP